VTKGESVNLAAHEYFIEKTPISKIATRLGKTRRDGDENIVITAKACQLLNYAANPDGFEILIERFDNILKRALEAVLLSTRGHFPIAF